MRLTQDDGGKPPPWPGSFRNLIGVIETSGAVVHMRLTGGRGYAKVMGNPEGPHMLACEHVGTACAHWLGLQTFETAIVHLTVDEAKTIGALKKDASAHALPGPAFVAKDEEGAPWGGQAAELNAVENREDLAGLIVLDTWLRNHDRHSPSGDRANVRNVFLSERGAGAGRFRVVAMDMGHSIRCAESELRKSISKIDNVKDERVYGAFPAFLKEVPPEWLARWASRLAKFGRTEAQQIVQTIPKEWEVADETREAVVDLLCKRAAFVAENIVEIYRSVYETHWKLLKEKQ